MEGSTFTVLLQHQDTGALRGQRIVLDHCCVRHAKQHVFNKYSIVAEFVLAVIGNANLSAFGQYEDPL